LVAGVGVIAGLAAVVWFAGNRAWDGLSRETRADATARFSAEASRIVGRPVEIRCDEAGQFVGAVQHADGIAVIGGRLAYLTPERCHDLYRLAFKDDYSSTQTGGALAVLAHESWHLRGVRNKGATECYALQSGVKLGQRLGLSEKTARQMMGQQLAENALHARGSLDYLVPRECRDGGSSISIRVRPRFHNRAKRIAAAGCASSVGTRSASLERPDRSNALLFGD
jgi:hypothetical protein